MAFKIQHMSLFIQVMLQFLGVATGATMLHQSYKGLLSVSQGKDTTNSEKRDEYQEFLGGAKWRDRKPLL